MARRPVFIKCSVDGCERNGHRSGGGARGCCSKHYYRLLTHGDPLGGRTFVGDPMLWCDEHKDYQGDDCIEWPFGKAHHGYGLILVDGKNMQASRFMCILAHGEPETPDLEAAHTCHNGHLGCMNQRHLEWETRVENAQVRPRARFGSNSPSAKLSEESVAEMRRMYSAGKASQEELAELFGITIATVNSAIHRKTWRHVA
ncbi:hypothetical protein [Rhizobium leguminosarum]|uniref:hypothetical protein n=1 Tax=Rhizobium leguminosarum TaxID=384 RepID=UPI001C90AE28|nr:hypothetical protein [Rhizobium leguminosarum]MBY2986402.1 hypothetical protein [Rhizobium leguminosarum]